MNPLGARLVVEQVELRRLRLPLRLPYHLSLGTISALDMFIARVIGAGFEGIGEASTAAGYSHETAASVWDTLRRLAGAVAGAPLEGAIASLEATRERHPFATASLLTALETAADPPSTGDGVRFPLLATLNGRDEDTLADQIQEIIGSGYKTIKVKVGWEPQSDAGWVNRAEDLVAGRALLRVDANQGYAYDEALGFATAVDPAGIELFEQPFPPDAWEDTARLAERSPLPLMLDESILGADDLERLIAERCASFVKFKLGKAGGLAALRTLIERARSSDLKVVLGNGVAGDIDCFHELVAGAPMIDTAGEMNGFLKPVTRLLENPYGVESGSAVLPPGYRPRLDWALVEAHTVDRLSVAPDDWA